MSALHGEELVTLTEARVRLHELIRDLPQRNVLLLRHGKPVAVMLPIEGYARLLDQIENLEDRIAIFESRADHPDMKVPWEKAEAEAGLLGED